LSHEGAFNPGSVALHSGSVALRRNPIKKPANAMGAATALAGSCPPKLHATADVVCGSSPVIPAKAGIQFQNRSKGDLPAVFVAGWDYWVYFQTKVR